MKKKLLAVVAVFGVAIVTASFNFGSNMASATVPGTNTLVSVNNTGNGQGGNDSSSQARISANGRYVTFSSGASNLVSGDTNGAWDVFVRDLDANTTTRVSLSTAGVQADTTTAADAISATGRYVLFTGRATNLIDGQTISGTYQQLYVRDIKSGTTELITKSSGGAVANKDNHAMGISSDGRFVLFTSAATNLGPTVTNSPYTNLYMADRKLNTMTLLNQPASGSFENVYTNFASMSCDGSIIAFYSPATNLVASDTNGHDDVFVLDRRAGSSMENITSSANAWASSPVVSCNGDYIGFTSGATNLTSGVTSGYNHAYRYDRTQQEFTLLDQSSGGTLGNGDGGGNGNAVGISDDGNAVFYSAATNLTSTTPTYPQFYYRNLKMGTTELLSKNSSGTPANAYGSSYVFIDAFGKRAAYYTTATNLIASDTNGQNDVFVSETGN